jgi:hypothetical protein
LSITGERINKPEHREKPTNTKKANMFDAINVYTLCYYKFSSSLLSNPFVRRKDIMIVMKGLTSSIHILGSRENCFNLLTVMAMIC